jgi:SAM-dependent methyltransferase
MMDEFDTAVDRCYSLLGWFDSALGRSLQAYEAQTLRQVLPKLYGTTALQLGRIGQMDLLDSCVAPTRIVLDLLSDPRDRLVLGQPEALPFDGRSIDTALLPHTLDFCDDPHKVLRETARVLSPEGHIVILGFNPVSLWGLRRSLTRRPRQVPWSGRFYRLARIKDWLALLDFQVTHGNMLFYQPPLAREGVMERMHFLDRMGDRWWPLMAAVYMVVARKRVAGMTPLPLRWKTRRLVGSAITEPSVRGIVVPYRRKSLG